MTKTIIIEDNPDDEPPAAPDIARAYVALSSQWAKDMQPAIRAISASVAVPAVDFSALVPQANFAALMPTFDTSILASNIDTGMLKIISDNALAQINLPDLAPFAKLADSVAANLVTSHAGMFGDLAATALQSIIPKLPTFELFQSEDWKSWLRRLRVPDNWSDEIDDQLEDLAAMINDEGIPAAWVPRREILDALLAAAPGDDRSEILIARRTDILEDCRVALEGVDDDFLAPLLPIATKVLAACRDGHWEVGAISAVAVVHGVVEGLRWVYDRQRVATHHAFSAEAPLGRMTEMATRAPLVLFYDDWNPESGKPRPQHLTRHVVSHRLGPDQVSERNCVIAVMLMASLIVTVHELELGTATVA